MLAGSVVPTRVEREASSPGNKTCKTGNTLFIEVKIGKRSLSCIFGHGFGSDVAPEAFGRFIAAEPIVSYVYVRPTAR